VPREGTENSCPMLSTAKLTTMGSTEQQANAKELGKKA